MSTTTLEADAPPLDTGSAPARHREGAGVNATGILRSEWLKLRSVRSSTTTLAAAAGSLLLVGLIFAGILGGVLSGGGDESGEFAGDPAGATLSGAMLAQLAIGVLGVLVITSEYATGLIRTTMTAVPKRLPVLWGKAAVLTVATFPIMLASALVVLRRSGCDR